ncbi:MAG: HIT family protein [Steroidobacterales bacterium]
MSDTDAECVFCNIRAPIAGNQFAFAIFDRNPVSPGHVLILPKRHVASFFETTPDERAAMLSLLIDMKRQTDATLAPDGYNMGVNVGVAAGQTVMHVHMHLIPRFSGDMDNPRGGVRGVIPAKQNY